MDEFFMIDAISCLDEDLIEKYALMKMRILRREENKRRVIKLGMACASVLLLFVISWAVLFLDMPPTEIAPPDFEQVIWNPTEETEAFPMGENSVKKMYGFSVASDLYSAFQNNEDEKAVFAIWVCSEQQEDITKIQKIFERSGIYTELKDDVLYIFATEKQISQVKMSIFLRGKIIFRHADQSEYFSR